MPVIRSGTTVVVNGYIDFVLALVVLIRFSQNSALVGPCKDHEFMSLKPRYLTLKCAKRFYVFAAIDVLTNIHCPNE